MLGAAAGLGGRASLGDANQLVRSLFICGERWWWPLVVGISATLSIRDATLVIQQTAPHDLLRQGRRCQVRRERSGAQRDNIIASSCSRLGVPCHLIMDGLS